MYDGQPPTNLLTQLNTTKWSMQERFVKKKGDGNLMKASTTLSLKLNPMTH